MELADGTIFLTGIVGSTAHGLSGPDSDVDQLGVFQMSVERLTGLYPPTESQLSVVQTKPDITLHEVGKLCRLLLKANPSVTELLWLPEDLYEVRQPLGDYLLSIRSSFLSARAVRNAYFNYARDQFTRMGEPRPKATIGDPDPDAEAKKLKQQKKNARHILRLLDQGLHLYRTGELIVRVDDPKRYFDFGEDVVADPAIAKEHLAAAELAFDRQPSALPEEPDEALVGEWLLAVRTHLYVI
jgi:hypothetical protein